MPLMAKQTTAPRAAISMALGLRWKMSARTAAMAKASPSTLSQSGARTSCWRLPLRLLGAQIFSQTKLQQESGESDGRDHDQGERTGERGAAGVDDDQREREQKQSGGDDAPAAGLRP